jgi:peptidyl-dipeptidase Dcp
MFAGVTSCAEESQETPCSELIFPSRVTATGRQLLLPWRGPDGGLPPFDAVQVQDFPSAFNAAIKLYRVEIRRIAENSEAATFANTIEALETAGATFSRLNSVYHEWAFSKHDAAFSQVEEHLSPILSAFDDELVQNEKLFQRIDAVYNSAEFQTLTPEQQRVTSVIHEDFVKSGARLDASQKQRVAEINAQLSELSRQFRTNVLNDEQDQYLLIEKHEDLTGLPQNLVDAFATEAEARGQSGKWIVANTRSAMEPFLTYSANRPLREQAFKTWNARGNGPGANNNNEILKAILQLRLERSKIFGFKNYAEWALSGTMAKTPDAAMELMVKVWQPAIARVSEDVAVMQTLADADNVKIEPWDYRYYAEKVRKSKYDFDLNELTPYLQLENIKKAMFTLAQRLYNFEFVKVDNVPVFHETVEVYRVVRGNGDLVGYWYFDPFQRVGKKSGAQMDSYRLQSNMNGQWVAPIVSNSSNFIVGKKGEPTYLSWDDAITMFHEFGHGMHGLSSNVTYPTLSGTRTARDFVELPSQFHENYLETREILQLLTNNQGQPVPEELIQKLERTQTFNQAFHTVEYLSSALIDMKLHLLTEIPNDIPALAKQYLAELKMPSEIVLRHGLPHFSHIFGSEGYAAMYYSYLWSQVLDQDAFAAFVETGDAFDPATADRFFRFILSSGNSVDNATSYSLFRGRDANVDALLRRRGFMSQGDHP